MDDSANRWSEQRIETIVANLLRAGVVLAASVVAFGGILFLIRHGREIPHYGTFTGEPEQFRSIRGIFGGAASLQGRNIIQLGLLVLIATPVARVAFSVVAFALGRDRMYVCFTLVVLAVLIFSLAGGRV